MKLLYGFKKGIFFSIVSIFLIILFTAIINVERINVKESELSITRTRVKILNSIMSDLEEVYFEKILYVSVKNALLGLSDYYHEDYDNIKSNLLYALSKSSMNYPALNYTNGDSVDLTDYVIYDYTVEGLTEEFDDTFSKLGIKVNDFRIELVEVTQEDPWYITVTADIYYYFSDETDIASWKGVTTKTVNVSVYGLYGFDYELDDRRSNVGIITTEWKEDNGTTQEPTIVQKLGTRGSYKPDPKSRTGICKDYCVVQ